MSRLNTYKCDRCRVVDPDTVFLGGKQSNNGWLQVSQDVHYCPSCQDKYEDFLILEWVPNMKFYKPCIVLFEGIKYELISDYIISIVGQEPPKASDIYRIYKDES